MAMESVWTERRSAGPGSGGGPAGGGAMPIYFTTPESSGLRHEFLPDFPFALDPRNAPGWTLPPVSPDDPVGIERGAYHTLLTDNQSAVTAVDRVLEHRGQAPPAVRLHAFSSHQLFSKL